MSQNLVEAVALVTYGNLYLQDRTSEFDFDKMVAEHCYRRDFMDFPFEGIAGSNKVLATNANKWFKYLNDKGAKRLKLFYKKSNQIDLPDHISTAFDGGGSQWIIEAQFETTSDLYLTEWYPSTKFKLDTRKTHVVRFNRDTIHLDDISEPVRIAREKLSKKLQQLSEFASKYDYSQHWVENFKSALMTLLEFKPQASDEFLPADIYSTEARQLIQGAFASWVFGGMGSWNDMSFSGTDQAVYESLSEDLYTSLCNAIVAAVNSYP
jgi:hypothetical protein